MGRNHKLQEVNFMARLCKVCIVIFLLSLLLIGIQQPFAQVQVTEEWIARYNGPGNGTDSAAAIATDSFGNIYVTGASSGSGTYDDYTTVSYDSSGNERWVARYNGPANYSDDARAIAVDLSGNVYVTGESYGMGTWWDYATVSYDSSGNERWVRRYNGPGNYHDIAVAIAVDSSGNVYVTGESVGSGTGEDYATVSYDSSGNERWVKRYDGQVMSPWVWNKQDRARDIAVDSSGNVYVTGDSGWIGWDYTTIAYGSSGNERWVARYQADGNNEVKDIAIDSSGNICVTGGSYSRTGWWDYATVSYDSSGNERWVARYNGPANHYDYATDIVIDSSGNVYVTGYSYGYPGGDDYATIKYSQMTKLPLGGSVAGMSAPGSFKVFVPSRYGGELTVSVVDSITGFPAGSVELFYPDFNTPIPSTEDIDLMPSIFKYEVPQDKYGWYYVKVTGSTNYTVSNTFIEKGEVLPERKPWNISTWWPFSDVIDSGDSLSTDDDASTISEIETLDDSIYPKYDVACGLYSNDSATYWETAKSVLADGHYIYNGEDRETHAEFDWKYDWNGTNGIENPGPYDFFSNTPGEGLFYSDGDLNDTYNSTWWGHCNGWARASIIFQEPSFSQLRNGFTPQDVKGLLTEIGMKETREDAVYQYQEPDEGAWAKEIHDFLKKFIKDNKMAIWGDLKSTERIKDKVDEVWNHPIWYYEASMKERPPQEVQMANELHYL